MKLIKAIVDKVKYIVTNEANDWKAGLRTRRTRLEEAKFIVAQSKCEPRTLTESEIKEFRELYVNGLDTCITSSKIISKLFTTVSFVDAAGNDMTWIVNGHLSKEQIVRLLLNKRDNLYPFYVAVSEVKDTISIRLTHNVLPNIPTEQGEAITEITLIDSDEEIFWKLFRATAIHTESYIVMSVRGTKYIVDKFLEKQEKQEKSIA